MITDQRWLLLGSSDKVKMCNRCDTAFLWEKSPSSMRQKYCSIHCEIKGEGFYIDSLIKKDGWEFKKSDRTVAKPDPEEEVPDLSDEQIDNIVAVLRQEEDDGDDGELVPV